jgi:hypothetical protein
VQNCGLFLIKKVGSYQSVNWVRVLGFISTFLRVFSYKIVSLILVRIQLVLCKIGDKCIWKWDNIHFGVRTVFLSDLENRNLRNA